MLNQVASMFSLYLYNESQGITSALKSQKETQIFICLGKKGKLPLPSISDGRIEIIVPGRGKKRMRRSSDSSFLNVDLSKKTDNFLASAFSDYS